MNLNSISQPTWCDGGITPYYILTYLLHAAQSFFRS